MQKAGEVSHRRGRRSGARGWSLAALGVAAALTVSGWATAPPAGAATEGWHAGPVGDSYVITVHYPGRGPEDVWLGALRDPDGSGWAWCIEGTLTAPPVGSPAVGSQQWDDATARAVAWVTTTVEATGGPREDVAAASYLVRTLYELAPAGGGSADEARAAVAAASPAWVRERAAALLAAGRSATADLTTPVKTATYGDSGQRSGTVSGYQVLVEGRPVAGVPFTVTMSGTVHDADRDGVADPGESPVYRGTTVAGDTDIPWVATATGDATWTAEFDTSALARPGLEHQQFGARLQDMVRPATTGGQPAVGGNPSVTFEVARDFQPVAASDVGAAKVLDLGEPLSDTLTVSAAPGETWLTTRGDPVDVLFEGTAYAAGAVPPEEPSATVPEGAEPVASASFVADGPGTYAVTAPGPAEPGVVTWVWRVVKAHQTEESRDLVRDDWSDAFGLAAETTSVRWQLEIDSALTIRQTAAGTRVVDDVWKDGFPADHPAFGGGSDLGADLPDLQHELWFFPPEIPVTDENLPQAQLLGSVTLDAADGFDPTVGSTAYLLPRDDVGELLPGTVVARVDFPGDDRVAPFTSTVTDVTEQYVIPPRDSALAVTTRAHTDTPLVEGGAATLHDVAVVTGTVPVGATIEFDLYRWAGTDAVCSPGTLVDRVDAVALAGAGEHTSRSTRVAAAASGTYGYVARVRDDRGRLLAEGACGDADESIAVRSAPPAVLATTGGRVATGALGVAAVVGGVVLRAVHRARAGRAARA